MFIIYVVFVPISSCKNYASSKDVKNLEQDFRKQAFLGVDTKDEIKKIIQSVVEYLVLKRDWKKIKEWKDKIDEKIKKNLKMNSRSLRIAWKRKKRWKIVVRRG